MTFTLNITIVLQLLTIAGILWGVFSWTNRFLTKTEYWKDQSARDKRCEAQVQEMKENRKDVWDKIDYLFQREIERNNSK